MYLFFCSPSAIIRRANDFFFLSRSTFNGDFSIDSHFGLSILFMDKFILYAILYYYEIKHWTINFNRMFYKVFGWPILKISFVSNFG